MKKQCTTTLPILLVTISIILIYSFFDFAKSIDYDFEQNTTERLMEIASKNGELINTKIEAYFETLKGISEVVSNESGFNNEKLTEYLTRMTEPLGYQRMACSNLKGDTWSNDKRFSNVQKETFFQTALKGETVISDSQKALLEEHKIIILAVPILDKNKKIIGVLSAELPTEELYNEIMSTSFNGKGYSYIIHENGEIITKKTSDYVLTTSNNIFDLYKEAKIENNYSVEQLEEDIKDKKSGHIAYTYKEEVRHAIFMPIGINDWVSLCVVPQSIVAEQVKGFKQNTFRLIFKISVVFLIGMAYSIWTQHQTRKMREEELRLNEQRLEIIAKQIGEQIFEYDITENTILYTNAKKSKSSIKRKTLLEIIERNQIVQQDIPAFLELYEKIRKGEKSAKLEYRIIKPDGTIEWSEATLVNIFDQAGKPVKAIGRLVCIEEKKVKEMELEHKASIDQLTGLYNKVSTEKMINAYLSKIEEEEMSAIYAIDIDNFKMINDQFGHLFGDQVIKEIAESIKSIFRSEDIIGRFGGDEFIVFLKNIPTEEFAEKKAKEICDITRRVYEQKGQQCEISSSIGIATYPRYGSKFKKLYANADKALYQLKEKGKDGYEILK